MRIEVQYYRQRRTSDFTTPKISDVLRVNE